MFLQSPSIWYFDEVSSCLDVARLLVRDGRLSVWDSAIAASQTSGRGQMRRTWISPRGNIYASLRLPMSHPFDTSAAAPAVGLLLTKALRQTGYPVLLKWPNDVVLKTDGSVFKVGGILLEERSGVLIAGIGINVQSAPPADLLRREAAMPAASLASSSALRPRACPKPCELWRMLVMRMFSEYNDAKTEFNSAWRREAEAILLWRHEHVEVRDGSNTVCGVLEGLGSDGGLLLRHDGLNEEFFGGDLHPGVRF